MMRALKITVLVSLVLTGMFGATLAWLVRSEEGARWLLEQGVALAPVSIELNGIAGTFEQGLILDSLIIELPVADIRGRDIELSWSPGYLLAGKLWLDHVYIGELDVELQPTASDAGPSEDALDWLQLPLFVHIESGELDLLRIDAAEFAELLLSGAIGHGRLDVAGLSGQVAGASVQISGQLTGPAPGNIAADVSWELPTANLSGSGTLSGDIEELQVKQQINVPEAVNFSGTIYDLFGTQTLAGTLDWTSVRLPGTEPVYVNAGTAEVNSNFRSARFDAATVISLNNWPAIPLQLVAVVDARGTNIESYAMQILDGQIVGTGNIDYSDGLQGKLSIEASQVDVALINADVPGRLGFDALLRIETADTFTLEVAAAQAIVAGNKFIGDGSVSWQGGEVKAAQFDLAAGSNRLVGNVTQDQQLAGKINADLPELALLWPGLEGLLSAEITLGGSLAAPQIAIVGEAASLVYGPQSIDTLAVAGKLQTNNKLAGTLTAGGIQVGGQELGNFNLSLKGSLDNHQALLTLVGGIANIELRTTGGWNGELLAERFEYGRVQPDGFDSWLLDQPFGLGISASGGQLDAHCWRQADAGICVDKSTWAAASLQSNIDIRRFALSSLQPLLAEGYSIDGTVDANLQLSADDAGLRGELRWRQARTMLNYSDGIDDFQAQLDEVRIDLSSDATRTNLVANVSGAEGLTLTANADVSGPLAEASPVTAVVNGNVPSIALLRPLFERVLNTGELRGELTIDLDVGGTLGDPTFMGGASLRDAEFGLLDAGITLREINISAKADSAERLVVRGQLRSGEGSAEIGGDIHSENNQRGVPVLVADISVKGENLASVRMPDLSVDTSPDLKLRIGTSAIDMTGTLEIPYARAEIRELSGSAVPPSADVIVHAPQMAEVPEDETSVTGDVKVLLGNDVRFKGFGLDSRLDGSLRLAQGRSGNLVTTGTVRVRDGFLNGYGKELRVDRGELTFIGPLDNPTVNVQVSRESSYEGREYTVGLRLSGTAQNIRTEPFSRPPMSNNDVLSFLLIDRPGGSGAAGAGAAAAMALGQLMPGDGGMLGLDEVGFETDDADNAMMVAGKRINDDIYVRYVFGTSGEPGAFRIRYRLGKGFSLEASTGSSSQQSLDLIYILER